MRRFFVFVFLAFLWPGVLILSGCATDSKVARVPEPPPAIMPPPPIQAKAPELPSELPAVQSLPKPKEMEEGIFKERLYSLSYREAEVRDVLMAFARESSYNIIVDPEVSGKITVDLKKVTLSRALDSLLKPLGLDYKQEGRFILRGEAEDGNADVQPQLPGRESFGYLGGQRERRRGALHHYHERRSCHPNQRNHGGQ